MNLTFIFDLQEISISHVFCHWISQKGNNSWFTLSLNYTSMVVFFSNWTIYDQFQQFYTVIYPRYLIVKQKQKHENNNTIKNHNSDRTKVIITKFNLSCHSSFPIIFKKFKTIPWIYTRISDGHEWKLTQEQRIKLVFFVIPFVHFVRCLSAIVNILI